MKKNNIFLILSFLVPFFVFSQQWHAYSDSIISNINNESIDASNSIDDTNTAERDEKFMMKKSSLGHRLQRLKAKKAKRV